MAGRGPAPQVERYRRGSPARGEWKPSEQSGWQHGDLPPAPGGMRPGSQATWETWFKSWWAVHWTPDDLPGLRLLIYLYDRVSRGDMRRLGELRQLMDSYGITPKGQQDRRWQRPEPPRQPGFGAPSRYAHLRATDDWRSAKERFKAFMGEADGSGSVGGSRSRADPRNVLRSHPEPRRKA